MLRYLQNGAGINRLWVWDFTQSSTFKRIHTHEVLKNWGSVTSEMRYITDSIMGGATGGVRGILSPSLLGPGGTGGYNENDLPGD